MTPIHILWTRPLQRSANKLDTFCHMLLSLLMAKRLYGKVHLMTDYYGKHMTESLGIPYDKIHLGLDYADYDKGFPTVKVYGYKKIVEEVPNFLYLDYDVFLGRRIPNERYVVQADEGVSPHPSAIYHYLKDEGIRFPMEYGSQDLRYYNMGLFRADKRVVYHYFDNYFSTLYGNQHLYKGDFLMNEYTMFLEQNLVYHSLKEYGCQVYEHYPTSKEMHNKYGWEDTPKEKRDERSFLGDLIHKYCKGKYDKWFDSPANIEEISKTGYVHLAHYKLIPNVKSDVLAYAFENYPREFAELINQYSKFH